MKMKRLLAAKKLFVLTVFSGVVNILYLLYFSGTQSLSQINHGFGRQISSIDEDSRYLYPNVANYGPLEILNSELKETLDKYSASANTLGEEFIKANLQNTRRTIKMRHSGESYTKCLYSPFLLIQVHSKPSNFMSREAIRMSWGSPDNAINRGSWTKPERSWKTVFLVGASNNSKINDLLKQESRLYGDVIIGDFPDKFRHLSHKMLLSLKWPVHNCRSKYIMKTDEDCFVNIIPLMLWLNDYHIVNGYKDAYIGKVQSNVPVERDEDSRYFVSIRDHPGTFYKPYISGGGYLFSGHLLKRLVDASKVVPLLPVEDVTFGHLMRHIGVKPQMNPRFLPFVNCERSYETLFERPMCHFKDPFIVHGLINEQQIHMHFNVLLMNFVPTICSYVDSQRENNHLSRIC